MSRKRKKKRERLKKQEIERNKGRVYCTIRVFCEGDCKNHNFKRNGRLCSEAYYKTGDGEMPVSVKIGMEGGAPPAPAFAGAGAGAGVGPPPMRPLS